MPAALLRLAATALAVVAPGHHHAARAHVIGGIRPHPASVPWVVNLPRAGCSGSLITPDRVLTAGHCTAYLAHGQRVVLAGGEVRHVRRIADDYRYTRFTEGSYRGHDDVHAFDAAIIQLDRPVRDVAPIRLARPDDALSYPPGTAATTLGYGVTRASEESGPTRLHSGHVEIHGDRACRSWLAAINSAGDYSSATMLCTTDPDHRRPYTSGCFGDSGGPLVVREADSTPLQVGVDNWGVYCGDDGGDPENYTDAAVISAFATAPEPEWQPLARTLPRLRGRVAVGSTVFCRPPVYADPAPRKLVYWFLADRVRVAPPSTSRRFVIPARVRHKLLGCAVASESRGGETYSTESVSTLVRGPATLR